MKSQDWTNYINPITTKLDKLSLEVEAETDLYQSKKAVLVPVDKISKGTKLKIKSKILTVNRQTKYVSVAYNRKQGLVPLKDFKRPIADHSVHEMSVAEAINTVIRENNGIPINVVLDGSPDVYEDISGAVVVDLNLVRRAGLKYSPKADVILYKKQTNKLSTENIYISLKKPGGADGFLQYGGLSRSGAGSDIYNHPETQIFLQQVTEELDNNMNLTKTLFKKVKSKYLKNMAIFGPDYPSKYSLQHVNMIGQGTCSLEKTHKENTYKLSFGEKSSLSGSGMYFEFGYNPVFGATYSEKEGFDFKDKRYKGIRVGIYPLAFFASRTNIEELK